MNVCYSILFGICLFWSGAAFAQDTASSKHPKFPSWLPHPPEHPARTPRKPSATQAYKRSKIPSWLPHPQQRSDTESHKPSVRQVYKPKGFPNVLTANLMPLLIIMDNPCISIGIEYERFITKSGMFSASLGGYWHKAAFYVSDLNYSYFDGYQVMPAFLYHPLGNTRRGDISVGPCLALGRQRYEIETRDMFGGRHTSATNTPYTALLGQFNFTAHHAGSFVIGIHFSAGAVISETSSDPGLVQLGVKFGTRF